MSYTFDHVHLQTTDFEATLNWFTRMFDAETVWQTEFDGTQITRIVFHGNYVNIFHRAPTASGPTPESAVIHHFALQPQDFDAAIEDLKGRGAEFHTQPRAVGDHLQIAYINGPDNLRIEIIAGDLPKGYGLDSNG